MSNNQPVSHQSKEICEATVAYDKGYQGADQTIDGSYQLCKDILKRHRNGTKKTHHEEPTKPPSNEVLDVQYQCNECGRGYMDFKTLSSCIRFHIDQTRCREHKAELVANLRGEEEAYTRAKTVQRKLALAAKRVERAEIKRRCHQEQLRATNDFGELLVSALHYTEEEACTMRPQLIEKWDNLCTLHASAIAGANKKLRWLLHATNFNDYVCAFEVGDAAIYTPTEETVTVLAVHFDDGPNTYFTIRMAQGSERQTPAERLIKRKASLRHPCPRCGDRYGAALAASCCPCEQEPRGLPSQHRVLRMTVVNEALDAYRHPRNGPEMDFESTELITKGDGTRTDYRLPDGNWKLPGQPAPTLPPLRRTVFGAAPMQPMFGASRDPMCL